MLNHFTVYGYGTNKRGLTIGINHKSRADSQESARAAAILKAQDAGMTHIRITRVQEVAGVARERSDNGPLVTRIQEVAA